MSTIQSSDDRLLTDPLGKSANDWTLLSSVYVPLITSKTNIGEDWTSFLKNSIFNVIYLRVSTRYLVALKCRYSPTLSRRIVMATAAAVKAAGIMSDRSNTMLNGCWIDKVWNSASRISLHLYLVDTSSYFAEVFDLSKERLPRAINLVS